MAKAEPKRRRGCNLGIPAADPAHGKAGKSHREHGDARADMGEDIVKSQAAQHGESQEACHQRQRHPVRDRHGEKVAGGCECHQGRKQQKAGDVEDHGVKQPVLSAQGRSIARP